LQRRWSNFFEGADRFLATMFGMALMAPGYTARDVNDWLDGQSLSAEKLVPETAALEPGKLAGELRVPVFVIQGDEDFTTPTSLARQFLRSIQAPRKVFVALRGGGHFAVFIQSAEFLRELRARVRPLATRSRAP
jgi:pimeloyl-ACP methyl ester carboxylesterase